MNLRQAIAAAALKSTIVKVVGEGCQARNEIEWIGKIIDWRYNEKKKWSEVIIEIVLYNNSYNDARGDKEPEIYTYPLVNNDIQDVKGVWILFT